MCKAAHVHFCFTNENGILTWPCFRDSHTAVTSPGDMVTVYVNGGRGYAETAIPLLMRITLLICALITSLEAYKNVVGLAQYPAKMAIFNSLTVSRT